MIDLLIHPDRLSVPRCCIGCEQVYLDCWKKMFDGKEWQLVDKPTPRDLSVMLTMAQWLGTNVGQQFLRESQLQSESKAEGE